MGIGTDIPPTKKEMDDVDDHWKKYGKKTVILCISFVVILYVVYNLPK